MAPPYAWIASSRAELLAGAESRVVIHPGDARSGSSFERLTIDGIPYFAKTDGYRTDWIMRITGDRDLRALKIWRAGLMGNAPATIDHTVVGMAAEGAGEDAMLTVLMRDVREQLFEDGDVRIDPDEHFALIGAIATLGAHFWGWEDDIGLIPMEQRLTCFAPATLAPEAAADDPPPPVRVAMEGWARLEARAPALSELAAAVHAEPGPLADAMRSTPTTFIHGDWKLGNLGRHTDGRTILLDWSQPGSGPALWDLAWYLALNAARTPVSNEATIDAMRRELEARRVSTERWFDLALDLCLLGMATSFGWEKAMGDDDELRWWEQRAIAGARHLRDAYPVPRR
jgi:hypothetical protein